MLIGFDTCLKSKVEINFGRLVKHWNWGRLGKLETTHSVAFDFLRSFGWPIWCSSRRVSCVWWITFYGRRGMRRMTQNEWRMLNPRTRRTYIVLIAGGCSVLGESSLCWTQGTEVAVALSIRHHYDPFGSRGNGTYSSRFQTNTAPKMCEFGL